MRQKAVVGLPAGLMALVATQAHALQGDPTAIRKMPPDSSAKLLREHLAFQEDTLPHSLESYGLLSPREAILAARLELSIEEEQLLAANSSAFTGRPYRPAFNSHENGAESRAYQSWGFIRRAREVVQTLQGRQTCPQGMSSCDSIGAPAKCCSSSEVCVEVDNPDVGNVACCPVGLDCNAPVAGCPERSLSCSADLGGGCCIPGFICQGLGCIPSPVPVPTSTSRQVSTVTTTSTTSIDGGEPSTVVVTVIITASQEPETSSSTTTRTITPTTTNSGVGPPMRPTSDVSRSSTTELSTDTCPTGFYGCLARHGGGCCRTERDCGTSDCPSTPSTTITSDGATIVVPVTDVPSSEETPTCANGWFLCGQEAGPVAGCCPSGYECGTASCTTVTASQTAEIQKEFPDNAGARLCPSIYAAYALAAACVAALFSI